MAAFIPKPFGKYFLVDKIAIGGMAEIYKAKTFGVDGFEKLLAIKKILPHYSADKEFISMLTDEAKLVVRLSHTNIVQIYDLGKVGDDYYISMEFIDGVNLREIINRAKELKEKAPLPLCLYILSEICKGLDYAHGKRDDQGEPLHIVHRDISPQNILISFEGETKIVDFGIAKAALNVSHTSAGILKGKVTYMSPEQALGKPIDGRTDIFSAGIILYELITGERLFAGDSQIDILNKIRNTPLAEDALKNIPEEVRPILAKALAFNVNDRYETAGDFQIALTKLLYSKYSDFSSKGLSLLIKKLFASELKIRKKKAIDEASIGSETKQELEQFSNQKSLLGPKQDNSDASLMVDTTRPEDKISAEMFKDTSKPEDKLSATHFINEEEEDQVKTNIRIDSGVSPLEDQPTSKSISIQFKKEQKKPLPLQKVVKWTIMATVSGLIIFGIYYYNPVLMLKNLITDLTQNDTENKENVISENEKPTNEIKEEAAPKVIDIEIKTNIPGALIYKNGENTGALTPFTLEKMPLNEKIAIILRKEGYEDLVFDIDPSKLTNTHLDFALKPVPEPIEEVKETKQETTPIKEIPIENKNKQITSTLPIKNETTSTNSSSELKTESNLKQKEEKTTKEKPNEESQTKESTNNKKQSVNNVISVSVNSEPNGATVLVDGIKKGDTPLLIELKEGTHKFILSRSGYATQSRSYKISSSQNKSIKFVLKANPVVEKSESIKTETVKTVETGVGGSLRIDSSPRGASVTINGNKAGITPVVIPNLANGSAQSIILTLPGYKSWSKKVNVGRGRVEISAPLQKE